MTSGTVLQFCSARTETLERFLLLIDIGRLGVICEEVSNHILVHFGLLGAEGQINFRQKLART
jgi:hypothetical protein